MYSPIAKPFQHKYRTRMLPERLAMCIQWTFSMLLIWTFVVGSTFCFRSLCILGSIVHALLLNALFQNTLHTYDIERVCTSNAAESYGQIAHGLHNGQATSTQSHFLNKYCPSC
jgi:hypothetical protein